MSNSTYILNILDEIILNKDYDKFKYLLKNKKLDFNNIPITSRHIRFIEDYINYCDKKYRYVLYRYCIICNNVDMIKEFLRKKYDYNKLNNYEYFYIEGIRNGMSDV